MKALKVSFHSQPLPLALNPFAFSIHTRMSLGSGYPRGLNPRVFSAFHPIQIIPEFVRMNRESRKAITAGILGNAIEWYDFALYGHLSVLIGKTFFPGEESELAVLSTFAVFSVSFFMRPIGAVIFSAIGDRYGRKRALSLSMLGMAIPTAGIGLIPSFTDIGYTATILLVLLRLIQGLSLGGEMGGAVTYVMEHTPGHRVGLASGLIQASTCLGLLAGTLISGAIAAVLSEAQFNLWGWRVPFLLGLFAAWIGLMIRRNMPESRLYERAKAENRLVRNPVKAVFANQKKPLLLGIAVLVPMTCCFFFAFVYFNSFMISQLDFQASRALMITSVGLMLSLSTTLFGGWLADRIGYRHVLSIGALLCLITFFPIIQMMSGEMGTAVVLPAFASLSILVGFYCSSAFAAVAGLFSTEVRYSGASLAVNIASPVFGSTAPLLAAWLIRDHGIEDGLSLFGGYLMVLFTIAATAVWRLDSRAFAAWRP